MNKVIQIPIPKENLSQQEVEQALQLIHQAWMTLQEVKIPWQLRALTEEQWDMLEQTLEELMAEKENSLLH